MDIDADADPLRWDTLCAVAGRIATLTLEVFDVDETARMLVPFEGLRSLRLHDVEGLGPADSVLAVLAETLVLLKNLDELIVRILDVARTPHSWPSDVIETLRNAPPPLKSHTIACDDAVPLD